MVLDYRSWILEHLVWVASIFDELGLGEGWDEKFPAISPRWRTGWPRLSVFFDYPPEIRRVIYTSDAIESLNYSRRKVLKSRGAFPTDEAIFKVLSLALNNVTKKWTLPIRDGKAALNPFVILFGERMPH